MLAVAGEQASREAVIPKVAEGVNLAVDAATVEGVGDLRG
jgi:hypothetical protein